MINLNQIVVATQEAKLSIFNRGFQYGDAVFETLRVIDDRIPFWEDHYFRLMASMRVLRMEIPMEFTLEFLHDEILKTTRHQPDNATHYFRVKLVVWRQEGGKYSPHNNEVSFAIMCESLPVSFYTLPEKKYVVDLYKDHYVAPDLLSTLKTNNRIINVLGSIYADDNDFQNCLLLNTDKKVIEALNGNLFLVKGNSIKTPPLEDGCLKGVIRKQLIKIINAIPDFFLEEESISPFELQKADEMFITNAISGIIPVTQYRKKHYGQETATMLLTKLNTLARSN